MKLKQVVIGVIEGRSRPRAWEIVIFYAALVAAAELTTRPPGLLAYVFGKPLSHTAAVTGAYALATVLQAIFLHEPLHYYTLRACGCSGARICVSLRPLKLYTMCPKPVPKPVLVADLLAPLIGTAFLIAAEGAFILPSAGVATLWAMGVGIVATLGLWDNDRIWLASVRRYPADTMFLITGTQALVLSPPELESPCHHSQS